MTEIAADWDHVQLETRVAELETLLQVSAVLNSSLRMEAVLEAVLEQAMEVLMAEAGTLWLLTDDGQELLPLVARGPGAGMLKDMRLKRGEGLAGQVAGSGEPVLVSDVAGDARWASRFDSATGFVTRSLLCVPLASKGKSLGSLQLVNKQGGQLFTPSDLRLCQALASQSAMVIENSQLYSQVDQMLVSLIRTLTSALDARDQYTRGHSERVSRYSLVIAEAMGMLKSEHEMVERAALLHDIGKIGVRDHILLQQGPLDKEAWESMKSHTTIGAQILKQMEPDSLVAEWWQGALCHQEHFDGKGYPRGLQGMQIPLVARIIAIADTFDAITTDRPYRKGRGFEEAVAEIERFMGTQFDPVLVKAFLSAGERVQAVLEQK